MRSPLRIALAASSLVVSGCAGPSSQAPAPARVASAPAPTSVGPTAAFTVPARELGGADGLVALCDLLRDEDRLTFPGSAVEQAEAREAYRERRLEAGAARYTVEVPAKGFAFRPYDLGERALVLEGRAFRLGEGAELYPAEGDEVPAFDLGPEAADRLLREHEAERLRLRLVFRPARSEMRQELCFRTGGGRIVKMAAQVLAAYLVGPEGVPLARAEAEELADAMAALSPVKAPAVTVRKPSSGDRREVPAPVASSAEALAPELLGCYRESLKAKPETRGTLVVGASVAADGQLESPVMEMSSVSDPALVSCALGKLARARLDARGAGLKLSIPIVFGERTR